jgi:hypothetical protein
MSLTDYARRFVARRAMAAGPNRAHATEEFDAFCAAHGVTGRGYVFPLAVGELVSRKALFEAACPAALEYLQKPTRVRWFLDVMWLNGRKVAVTDQMRYNRAFADWCRDVWPTTAEYARAVATVQQCTTLGTVAYQAEEVARLEAVAAAVDAVGSPPAVSRDGFEVLLRLAAHGPTRVGSLPRAGASVYMHGGSGRDVLEATFARTRRPFDVVAQVRCDEAAVPRMHVCLLDTVASAHDSLAAPNGALDRVSAVDVHDLVALLQQALDAMGSDPMAFLRSIARTTKICALCDDMLSGSDGIFDARHARCRAAAVEAVDGRLPVSPSHVNLAFLDEADAAIAMPMPASTSTPTAPAATAIVVGVTADGAGAAPDKTTVGDGAGRRGGT